MINGFIKDFYIYFKGSDIILTPYTSYIELPILYGDIFKYGKLSYQEWKNDILDRFYQKEYFHAMPAILNGKEYNVITYAQSLPCEYGSQGNGVVFCYIDESEIHKLMQKLQIGGGGWAYIVDKNGNILTSMGRSPAEVTAIHIPVAQRTGVLEKSIDNQDMMVSYTTSSYNQWTYVAVLPTEVILAKVKYVKSLFIVFTFIILAAGLLATYFMAERNSRPVQHALDVLAESLTHEYYRGGNIFDFLKNNIVNLIYNNKNLKDAIDQQIPLLKVAFFDRLLNGSFDDLEGMDEILNQIEFNKEENVYLVVLIQIHGYEKIVSIQALKEVNIQKTAIKEAFYNIAANRGYIHDMGTDELALILAFPKEQANDYKELTESLIQKIIKKFILSYQYRFVVQQGRYTITYLIWFNHSMRRNGF